MTDPAGDLTLTFSRAAVEDAVSAGLSGRMHQLPERGAGGTLSPVGRGELETIVRTAQLGPIITTAFRAEPPR